jgi:tRNA (cytidine56-2'-O)-methyltransferase
MQGEHDVTVLRLGHRPGRDDRMTTHVGLTARALGADRVVLVGEVEQARRTVTDITDRFGGPFAVETVDSYRPLLEEAAASGTVAHLTMYGEPIQSVETDLRRAHAEGPLLVVVGSQKVPFEVYERADYNVAVTNQPHSEVAGLAVFLDRLFEGRELDRAWLDADRRVVPQDTGKRVVDADAGPGEDRDGTRSGTVNGDRTDEAGDADAHADRVPDDPE